MLLEKKTEPGSYKWEPWGPPHPQPLLFSQSHSNLKAQGQLLSPTHLAGFLIIGRKEVTFWHPYLSEGATEPWAPHALLHGSGGGCVLLAEESEDHAHTVPPAVPCKASCGPWRLFHL